MIDKEMKGINNIEIDDVKLVNVTETYDVRVFVDDDEVSYTVIMNYNEVNDYDQWFVYDKEGDILEDEELSDEIIRLVKKEIH